MFSRKKSVKALEPAVDMQGTITKKKGLSLKFSPFKKENKLTVPFTPIPEVAAVDSEPVNEKVLETYSLIEPYCRVSIVKDLDRGNIKYVVEEPKLTTEDEVHLKRLKEILNQVITLKPSDLQSKETAGKYLS